jgi:hypothetical protein
MSLSTQVSIDKIEILEMNEVQVRQITRIFEDDVELSAAYHRWVLVPGDDVSTQTDKVKAVCSAIWTPDVISAYQAMLDSKRIGA